MRWRWASRHSEAESLRERMAAVISEIGAKGLRDMVEEYEVKEVEEAKEVKDEATPWRKVRASSGFQPKVRLPDRSRGRQKADLPWDGRNELRHYKRKRQTRVVVKKD